MHRVVFLKVLIGASLAALSLASQSRGLPATRDEVLLTVSGKIRNTNRPGQAAYDMAMLQALPQHAFRTRTPWQKEPIHFSGPLLRDVLAQLGADGSRIKATALNDYQVEIPVTDAQRFDVIVALRMNGEPMSVRSRGPLFIVYPFDSSSELRSVRFYERSIWQLRSLHIE
jgi:hypothetical protein